ncbi:tRNA (adenosine(37)-N6)-threonylcarbamoyltransferase complex dimerization subunit type 1 TsaB [Fibrivirga algicola]|uniref:tRNA (Adenosine(37)-N6)-threonylcarbamoyltransferase complex dimerization subunit type 1 TsaB n=1 Tax=Fibrivirga algicola TaxID=2950420 RepID=A0ABX0QBW8_9BACT|nr:tRNA (adenosine(37)-N6)-threonylcarbamoyltransferase complex dimerization subunit type 1 TsaB [Fibrivirga algicola]ARK09200.1 tRNA threonylcarbamoyladenosine biosynthesis protein TsaB [Fibrella sp. ES10-3-2-2]NID08685.1 tRNA (adenosine(37)-N6)-threonylcarbamoyltransferase complex dimerization subunit type 1 TsaB [Fibrivirga algicola]
MILSLDTSTTVCSVAVHQLDGTLLGCYELFTERTASARLTTLVHDVVTHAGYTLSDVSAIAVAKGPGSYTGLRIGVSTAKGLCMALDKPLLGINTLAAMTEQVRLFYPSDTLFCPMIDARRMEVYCAFYGQDGREVRATTATILDETSFTDLLVTNRIAFFGDGADKARPVLMHPNAHFPAVQVRPSARTVGTLAVQAYASGKFEDLVTFEPYYLKEFRTTEPKQKVPSPIG